VADQYLFRFNEEGLDRILQKVEQFRQAVQRTGEGDLGPGFERFFREFDAGFSRSTSRITQLRRELQTIGTALQQARVPLTKELAPLAGLQPTGRFATEEQRGALEQAAQQRIVALEEEQLGLQNLQARAQESYNQAKQREANLAEYTNRLEATRVSLVSRIRDVRPGGSRLNQLVVERENALLERQRELREQLAQAISRFSRAAPQEAAQILRQETSVTQQLVRLREKLLSVEQQIAATRQIAADAGFGRGAQGRGPGTAEEQAAALEKQTSLEARLISLGEQRRELDIAIASLGEQQLQNRQRLAAIESGGSELSRGATEVLNRLQQVDELIAKISTSSDALADIFGPEIHTELQQIQQVLDSFAGKEIDTLRPEEVQELAQVQARARELLTTIEQFPKEGIPLRLNEDELLAGVSLLSRVLLGATRDFGRRFTATLQFAISGALLFGTQRLLREFFDAAVEVERTFADISTSLEFDIDAERGTAEFERQVERVRRQVLQIADDFNALPTEVNAAAFQMISRFDDVEAALIATRAQVLATRVATISQEESLRALTSVAEAYSVTLAGVADDQERQRRQAQLYADALDKATLIQQKFGGTVEDVLEGAGGVAELFRTLGFSIDETFAIIRATVLKTGQTGAQVSDRLGRAFSSIETGQVRDELLALANQFDEFFLRPIDFFEGGREVFFQIADQFQSLDASLQKRIAEIIGQRRETAFISALLGAAGEGLVGEIVEALDESAGAAENRLLILLATVQGTIEGISTEFQELAQNLEELGIITPIRVLLGGLEIVLKTINLILTGALNLIETFNRIRIPFTDWGLGDALTTMLALVTAGLSLQGLFRSIQKIALAQGANTLIDVARSIVGLNTRGQGGAAVKVGAAAGSLLGFSAFTSKVREADGVIGKLGTTVGTIFLAPFRLLNGLFQAAKVRLFLWNAALVAGNATTATATATETGLSVARARTNILNGLLIGGTRGANLLLFGLGSALKALGGTLLRLPGNILAITGALVALRSVGGALASAFDAAFGPSRVRTINERTKEIVSEAELAGEPISGVEAQLQAAQERLDELAAMAEDTFVSFGLVMTGLAVFGLHNFEGTREFIDLETRIAELELAKLQLIELQNQVNELNAAAGGGPELDLALQPIQDVLTQVHTILSGIDTQDPEPGAIRLAKIRLEDARVIFEEEIPGILGGWGEVLTSAQISEEISNLQTNIQLGFTTLTQALRTLGGLRENALAALGQAIEGEDPEAIKQAENDLLDIGRANQQVFEQLLDAQLERAALIQDNRARLLAELRILRDFALAAANNPNLGPEAVRQAQQAVNDAEREYNDAILEEAIARRQFEVDTARTFAERIAALKRLFEAIQLQIASRIRSTAEALVPDFGSGVVGKIIERVAASVIVRSGVIDRTAAEDAQLQAILDQIADAQLRHAQLVARNSTLRNKSSLDNIAAIAATANALRAEISLLRKRGADEQEILAKEIELRDAVANQRLAEADRRAAFFRLTAGTGDEIKAAQGELRSALDRLATIEALGGGDTQAGYEAELAVLQARQRLVDLALRLADVRRRATSDLTDSFEQSLLDVQAAQEALRSARGEIEKLDAEISLREAESRAQREFYDRRISDLDFLFQTDQIGRSQYISALRALQGGIDRSTRQGEELWREIELQIRGLMDSADQAFNIPTEIRLPTLFEIRRALAADALGVNYQDNRQQEINVFVSDEVDVNAVIAAIESAFGGSIDLEAQRLASGGAGITIGGFS
jgi:hypothetical protein